MTFTLEWQPRPVIKTVFHKFVNWCHKLSKFRKKWTLDKGPESQNSTMEITVFQNNFALKLGLRTYSECTKSWVCHVIGVSNRKSQNVKWHENLLKFAFHAYHMQHMPRVFTKSTNINVCHMTNLLRWLFACHFWNLYLKISPFTLLDPKH